MPRFLNTDNGRVIDVADNEAFIYEKASNFEAVVQEKPPAPARSTPAMKPEPAKKTAKKKV
jgi:hypothetical protein